MTSDRIEPQLPIGYQLTSYNYFNPWVRGEAFNWLLKQIGVKDNILQGPVI